MSQKIAYIEIRDLLQALPEIETVRLFNNQFEKDNEEDAFLYPVVFVEFLPIEWISKQFKIKSGISEITFHIGIEELQTENVDIFDIIGLVSKALEGFVSPTSDVIQNPLKNILSEQDTDHDNIIVWKDTYTTRLNDFSNCTRDDETEIAAGTVKENLTLRLDIDNPIIRTGDGDDILPVYDPLTDDDLEMYYDFTGLIVDTDNLFGTVDSGGLISNWKNLKSNASFDLLQSITTSKLLLTADGISADGINDFLSTVDLPALIKSGGDFTFAVVGDRLSDNINNLVIFEKSALISIFHRIRSTGLTELGARDNVPTPDILVENNPILLNSTFINTLNYKDNWTIISNGNSTLSGVSPKTQSPLPDKLLIGRVDVTNIFFRKCLIKSVMVWKTEVTDAQKIIDINTFLTDKWIE